MPKEIANFDDLIGEPGVADAIGVADGSGVGIGVVGEEEGFSIPSDITCSALGVSHADNASMQAMNTINESLFLIFLIIVTTSIDFLSLVVRSINCFHEVMKKINLNS